MEHTTEVMEEDHPEQVNKVVAKDRVVLDVDHIDNENLGYVGV